MKCVCGHESKHECWKCKAKACDDCAGKEGVLVNDLAEPLKMLWLCQECAGDVVNKVVRWERCMGNDEQG